MTKKRKVSSDNQPSLFDFIRETVTNGSTAPKGSLAITEEVKLALSDDLRHASDEYGRELSRAHVAARMTDLLGVEITLSMLNNWTATSHPHEMPVTYLPAFIRATGGQRRAADVISRHSGLFLLPGPEALRAEIRRDEEARQELTDKIRRKVSLLKEVEGR